VVYLGFNETWRLRRQHGEKYYRQFWSQLIYRLGMSHALGAEKRFVARIDRQQYRAEDKVTLTVEAYDENYEPLGEESLSERGLTAELVVPGAAGQQALALGVPMLRRGVFEARKPTEQRVTRNIALWTTPLWFGVVVVLMLGEWLARKLMRLP
jgi:hypothetical protein